MSIFHKAFWHSKPIADNAETIKEGQKMIELRQTEFNEMTGVKVSNPNEPHMACVLLLDTSSSMNGDPINSLNKAIKDFKEQTSLDEFAQKRVDIAIIEFNDKARVVQEFTPLPQLQSVCLTAVGCTAMGEGINLAIDKVKERNRFYHSMGTPCYKPWIFMITDGEPTDDISAARQRIIDEENKGSHGHLKFWAVGVPGYSEKTLKSLTKRCIALNEAKFDGIFNWLSESMVTISVSRVDEDPKLPNLSSDAQVIPSNW